MKTLAFALIFAVVPCVWSRSNVASCAEPTHRDIRYARVDDHELRLDIYQPPQSSEVCPLIVWVHGGAWRAGSKDRMPIERFLKHGFVIASVDYRLSPMAKFPAQVHDIKAAIRFLRANAERYRVDKDRVTVAGASAGGHLAALVGLSNDVDALEGTVGENLDMMSDVQAAISFYGASNLKSILSQSTPHGLSVRVPALKLLLGGTPKDHPRLAKLASPTTHVDSKDPPVWLIHGDADPQMPVEQSHELNRSLRQASVPVRFEIIEGAKHGGDVFYTNERLDQLAGELKAALR